MKTKPDFFKSAQKSSLRFLAGEYLRYSKHKGLSRHSLTRYRKSLSPFISWCEERGLFRADEIGRPVLEGYGRYLSLRRAKNKNQPLSPNTRRNLLSNISYFFGWLARQRYLAYNPAAGLLKPRKPPQRLKEILSSEEIERVLSKPDKKTALGLRDRCLMELFYLTGIRRRELFDLNLSDMDLKEGTLKVKGKNRKERLVPLGNRAVYWLRRYLKDARPKLVRGERENREALFLSARGNRIALEHIGKRVRFYFKQAGLSGKGCCHLFRHTMATLMLKNGADIRAVQEILGHDSLLSTQGYTHLNIEHLHEVYERTHPAAGLSQKKKRKNK